MNTVNTTVATNATVDNVMKNNTNSPKQIPYSIQNLLQIPQEQLTAAFPQNMVGFKSAYDKDNKFIPLKFIKALNKKLNIQTQWPVLDIKEKDQLYDEGYGFNFVYLTNDDQILITYDMFIIISQLVHYDFKPYISVEIQNILQKYQTINWQINQNPPPPVVHPKTKRQTRTKKQSTTNQNTTNQNTTNQNTTNQTTTNQTTNNQTTTNQTTNKQTTTNKTTNKQTTNKQNTTNKTTNKQTTNKAQKQKVQKNEDSQVKDVQIKQDTDVNTTATVNVDEQPKPKRRTTKKSKPQDILNQLEQSVGNNTTTQSNTTSNNQSSQNIEQQNIIQEFENTIKQCEATQNDEPTTTDNINNLLTTTDQDNNLTEEELKTTENIDRLLDFDAP